MIKKILVMVAVCALAISPQAEPQDIKNLNTKPLPKETQKKILATIGEFKNVRVRFEITDMLISDKNEIILCVKADENFADKATITIPKDADLKRSIEGVFANILRNDKSSPKRRFKALICLEDGTAFQFE